MNLSFNKGELFAELSDDDLLKEIKRRGIDLSSIADVQPSESYRQEAVRLSVDISDVLSELDDDDIAEEAEDRGLAIGAGYGDDVDERQIHIERLGVALHSENVGQVFELARHLYEQDSGRILN